MKPAREPLFLARRTYRQRRLGDAVRLVPVLGTLLFLLPLLGIPGGSGSTVRGAAYLFGAWAVLIVLTALLSRALGRVQGAQAQGAQSGAKAGPEAGPQSRTEAKR